MAAAKGRPTNSELALNFGLVGTSCVAAQATVHWTQTTMVRQQLAAMKGGEQLSFPAAVASIARSEGIAGLYRGFVAAAAREMSYSSLRFGLYEPIKLTMGVGRDSAPWQNVLAGVLAGTAAAAVASPTDLLTIRAMSQTGAEIGIRETARAIIAEVRDGRRHALHASAHHGAPRPHRAAFGLSTEGWIPRWCAPRSWEAPRWVRTTRSSNSCASRAGPMASR
jgi:hypothetical protein